MQIPGKLFLTGEYGALSGKGALIATVAPGFTLEPMSDAAYPHPESPAGRFLSRHYQYSPPIAQIQDQWLGSGGLGASTAEFIYYYSDWARKQGKHFTAEEALSAYREIVGLKASGYDLLVQARSLISGKAGGELYWVDRSPGRQVIKKVECPVEDFFSTQVRVMLFLCTQVPGRKLKTHEHLASIPKDQVTAKSAELHQISKKAFEEILIGTGSGFARALDHYRTVLTDLQLESPEARHDREAFAHFDGVWSVKGSGAMLHDALVVCLDPDEYLNASQAVLSLARDKGYVLLDW